MKTPLPDLVKLSVAEKHLPETRETLRRWCLPVSQGGHGIGVQRGNGKRWRISFPAARMLSSYDMEAFALFKAGEREDPLVRSYFTDR